MGAAESTLALGDFSCCNRASKDTMQESDIMMRAEPARHTPLQAPATNWTRDPDVEETLPRQLKRGGFDPQTQFALKMCQAALDNPSDSKLRVHAVFLLSTLSKGQQEDYVRLVPTRNKGVLADTISEVYNNMSAQSAGEKHTIIHQELKLGTEQERKCSFDFFSIPERYQEIVKTLRRTSQVMRMTGSDQEHAGGSGILTGRRSSTSDMRGMPVRQDRRRMSAADLAVEEWIEKSAVSNPGLSPSVPVVSRRNSHRVKDLRSAMANTQRKSTQEAGAVAGDLPSLSRQLSLQSTQPSEGADGAKGRNSSTGGGGRSMGPMKPRNSSTEGGGGSMGPMKLTSSFTRTVGASEWVPVIDDQEVAQENARLPPGLGQALKLARRNSLMALSDDAKKNVGDSSVARPLSSKGRQA